MSNLREHLQNVYDQHSRLTARLVVDTARDKNSPLHQHFEWDDSVAGEKYREHQARDLIRSIKIKYRNGDRTEKTNYFVSVERDEARAYHPVDKVAGDPELTEIVRRTMEREWRALQSRYGHFEEFVEMVKMEVAA